MIKSHLLIPFRKTVNIGKAITIVFTALAASAICVAPINAATVIPGDDLYIPSGLNVGDTYQLVFVTSIGTQATSTDIADYNSFVQGLADASTITAGIDWFVIGSTATVDAKDNAPVHVGTSNFSGVYNLGGENIANDYADMWNGSINSGIYYTEKTGITYTDSIGVFTGTTSSGVGRAGEQLGAVSNVSTGWSGHSAAIPTGYWIETNISFANTTPYRLFALSEEITVVPIPAAVWLFGSGLIGLIGVARRKTHG